MKLQSEKALVKLFITHLDEEEGIKLDFRSHVYLYNNLGLTPCFSYGLAEKVVSSLYAWAEAYAEEHRESYKNGVGFVWNLNMQCEKLRTETLRGMVRSVCFDLSKDNPVQTLPRRGEE